MYHHQFVDPTQTTINYSDLSLLGGGGSGTSSNNNSSFSHDHQPYNIDHDPSTLLKMLSTPSSFHHDGNNNFLGEVPIEPAAMYYDPTTIGFNVRDVYQYSVANHGIDVGDLAGFGEGTNYGGELNVGMVQLSSNKRKKKGGEVVVGVKNEKQRRERLSKKYEVLKALIPNPTKPDRATIVADTIAYIQELLRTVEELKMLVEKKRHKRSGSVKKSETVEDVAGDNESSCVKPLHGLRSPLRSSWLRRKSKDTHVDVRIVEDEVFIKLTQHKKIDCLVTVARVLDELELDLLHLSGGNIGDVHVFMFNAKIHEGSSVYAGAIAKKVIEAMDAKYQELFVSF